MDATDDHVTASWSTFGLGVGVLWIGTSWDGEAGLVGRVIVQRLSVTASDETTESSETASRWQPGLGAGLRLAWPSSGRVGVVAGVDAARMLRGTTINVRGKPVAESPALAGAAWIGLRITFDHSHTF